MYVNREDKKATSSLKEVGSPEGEAATLIAERPRQGDGCKES